MSFIAELWKYSLGIWYYDFVLYGKIDDVERCILYTVLGLI